MKALAPPATPSALIGFDTETDEPVAIGDNERRSGLYILGRSGMGKTELLLHLLDYDISKGHGVFFLDPNGDAIEDLIPRHMSITRTAGSVQITLPRSLYLLDPSNEDQAFGINLLACDDIESRDARARTYAKVRRVFDRLWEKELRQDLRPWLSLYLENSLYAFVGNQEYTLAELPLFLDARNIDFRYHIVGNVRHNPQVTYFWEQEFARSPRDQQERADALLTRVNTLLDPDVRHIVGQRRTTIDFSEVLAQQSVVLVRFPPTMPEDNRRFIGTILLSELVYSIQRREELDKTQRRQFCVFIDESALQAWQRREDEAGVSVNKHDQERHDKIVRAVQDCDLPLRHFIDFCDFRDGRSAAVERDMNAFLVFKTYPIYTRLLTPYLSARFAGRWKQRLGDCSACIADRLTWVPLLRKRSNAALAHFRFNYPEYPSWHKLLLRWHLKPLLAEELVGGTNYEIDFLDEFEAFLRKWGEGAFVMFALYQTLDGTNWTSVGPNSYEFAWNVYNALHVPALEGREPLEILRLLNTLADYAIDSTVAAIPCSNSWYFQRPAHTFERRSREDFREYKRKLPGKTFKADLARLARYGGEYSGRFPGSGLGVPALIAYMQGRWNTSVPLDDLTKIYLAARAFDTFEHGEVVANITFPQPTLENAHFIGLSKSIAAEQVKSTLRMMVDYLETVYQAREAEWRVRARKEQEEKTEEECRRLFRLRNPVIPATLPERNLTSAERDAVKAACISYMQQCYGNAQQRFEQIGIRTLGESHLDKILRVIDDFVRFCDLLSQPENHIMVHAGQYAEKPVGRRLVSDMAGEMAQELMHLPEYEAYAKIIQGRAGKKEVVTRRVRTLPPPPEPEWVSVAEAAMKTMKEDPAPNVRLTPACRSWKRFTAEIIEWSTRDKGICISRDMVEQEIGNRQAKWRKRVKFTGGEPPPPQIERIPDELPPA